MLIYTLIRENKPYFVEYPPVDYKIPFICITVKNFFYPYKEEDAFTKNYTCTYIRLMPNFNKSHFVEIT